MDRPYPHLFTPLKVKGLTFKNRLFSAPNANSFVENGIPNDYYIRYMEEKARGGAGMVVISEVPVDEYGAHNPHLRLDAWGRPMIAELVSAIKSHGAVCSVELTHGGDATVPFYNEGGNPISSMGFYRNDGVYVECMDEEMIERVANKFADAAVFFKSCGVDMCMVHAAHHWLLNQFLSPIWNRRTDKYGGSLENRCRFPKLVFQKVREAVGSDYVIDVRFGVEDMMEGGNGYEETLYFLNEIKPYIDMIHITAGARWETATLVQTTCFQPHGGIVHYAELVKKSGIGLPVVAHAGLVDPEMMEEIIASGKADAVAAARALIADPYFPKKAQLGMKEDIRPCLRCLTCLTGGLTYGHEVCAVNPTAYSENMSKRFYPIATKKKLLVVGGGPAGMQAAITAFDRGHDVTILEKCSELGGWLRFTDTDTVKEDLRRFKNYLIAQVNKREITVRLNNEATQESVEELKPDAIFVAAGSVPIVPEIEGIEFAHHASEVYFGTKVGKRVVIIGGGLVGCEIALHLANIGCEVEIIEAEGQFARDANFMHFDGMMKAYKGKAITIHTSTKCMKIEKDGVTVVSENGERKIIADTVLSRYASKDRGGGNAWFTCA